MRVDRPPGRAALSSRHRAVLRFRRQYYAGQHFGLFISDDCTNMRNSARATSSASAPMPAAQAAARCRHRAGCRRAMAGNFSARCSTASLEMAQRKQSRRASMLLTAHSAPGAHYHRRRLIPVLRLLAQAVERGDNAASILSSTPHAQRGGPTACFQLRRASFGRRRHVVHFGIARHHQYRRLPRRFYDIGWRLPAARLCATFR